VIRVELPFHLRTLARVDGPVAVRVEGAPTIRSVLDAVEAAYPMLRGAIRDHGTLKRRPFLRYYACNQDFSLADPDTLLPDSIVTGEEPFLVIGAIAGG
jgi:molybdopterin synthase sulfur carrier subunit